MALRLFIFILFGLFLCSGPIQAQKKKSTTRTTVTKKKSTTKKTYSPPKKSRTTTTSKKEVTSVSTLRTKRNALQQAIKQKESQLQAANKDVKRRLNDLAIINGKIDKQKKNINKIETQIDSLNHDIYSLTREHKLLCKQLKDRRNKYRTSLIYLYKNRKTDNKLLFILSANDFTQLVRRYRYINEYAKYQMKQGQLVQKKQLQVEEAKEKLQISQKNMSQALVKQKSEQDILARQQDEQKKTVATLQKKQKEIRNVIAVSKKEMAQLDAKIDYYIKLAIEQERKRQEAERRSQNGNQKNTVPSTGSSSSNPKSEPMQQWHANDKDYALNKNFSSNKGRFPMPITTSYIITAHYGNYNLGGMNSVQLSNKGINITGQSGAQARCIFEGKVSAVFSLGGLVNVLVRHGSYISVYCNLSSSSVRQGQVVSAKSILGNIARDASGRCTLHFQLRKETSTLNPESWLSR